SESLYRSILAASPDGITITDLQGRIKMVSPKARAMFGIEREEEVLDQEQLNFLIPEDRERARTNIGLMFQGVFTGPAEYSGITRDGKLIDIEANAEFVRDAAGNPMNIIIITREISDRKQAEAAQRHNINVQIVLKEIAEAALVAPSMTELFATVHRLVGRVFPAKLFHINLLDEKTSEIVVPYCADEVNFIPERRPIDKGITEYIMGLAHAMHVTPADMDRLRESGEYTMSNVQNIQVRHYLGAPLINPQGKPFGVMSLIVMGEANPFLPEDLEIFSIIAAQVSMAIDRKRLEEELRQQAMTDGLTGVLNRRYFMLRLEEELRRIRRYTSDCALLILDMDHFKQVNDTYGHAVGDEVLRQVAAICGGILRDTDVLGRIGGEEFGILLLEGSAEVSLQVAERLRQSVEELAFCTDQGSTVPLRLSIGATECLQTESVATVLRRADKALYLAKNRGRNQVAFCSAASSEVP
ncbi:MAG: putative signaling protein, partial [Firmicutes bacterium]|nr:putative signaling protein [Bacillota bacterium]